MSEDNINADNISDKELERAAEGAWFELEAKKAKDGEFIKPDIASDVTISGVNKDVQLFG